MLGIEGKETILRPPDYSFISLNFAVPKGTQLLRLPLIKNGFCATKNVAVEVYFNTINNHNSKNNNLSKKIMKFETK